MIEIPIKYHNNLSVCIQCICIDSGFDPSDEYTVQSIIDKFITTADLTKAEVVLFTSVGSHGTIRVQFQGENRLYFFNYDHANNILQFRSPSDLSFEEKMKIASGLIKYMEHDPKIFARFSDLTMIDTLEEAYHFISMV